MSSKHFCDLCGKENTDNSLSTTHWCGNFKIGEIRAEVLMEFNGELCPACRRKFEDRLSCAHLESWVGTWHQ